MAVSFPQLDVYFIDFSEESNIAVGKLEGLGEGLLKAGDMLAHARLPGMNLMSIFLALGISLTPTIVKSLTQLINENRFYIITSQQELEKFENACGNEWVTNKKSLKQKQYYIRHPKTTNRNLLVEAKSFYDYIEEEQKDELIDFILSNCPAKHIKIERIDVVKTKGKGSAKVKEISPQGSIESGISKKDIFNYKNPHGTQTAPKHNQYVWLNNSLMRSISALSEGGSLTQTYESDFTFGLSAGEAKTIGLDLSKHKKYTYSIHVEC